VKATFPVSAPPGAWEALADPERLAAALPGCRSVTRDAHSDGTLHVVTEVAVASVRGLWAGTVAPVDADAVHVRGSGAPGAVDLVVRADPRRTSITVEGTVHGALDTVGAAVLAGAVRRMAEDLLAATAVPAQDQSSRGQGFPPGVPEVMGSGSGTHDLDPQSAEPIASGPHRAGGVTEGSGASAPSGASARLRAALGAGAALVGAVALLVRRRARGRAG
jgi:carbon monoxide dehydrogenase subunit G